MSDLARAWLARDPDPQTRAELQALLDRRDDAEVERRFAGRLEFGTAGLRAVLGAGPLRMNRLVVRETSAGLGNYLLANAAHAKERGVVVGYDGRRNSRVFAADTAAALAALGIKTYLASRETPTPLCAFAVNHLGAAAGVVVTASHNPPEYNGYKVYWDNGAQIIPPHDSGIAAAIERASREPLPFLEVDAARRAGLVVDFYDEVARAYLAGVAGLSLHKPNSQRAALVVAYTPLHGVGAPLTEAALAQAGFRAVHTVAAQREPDGAFPTVRFPNPEEPGAMDLVLALARQHDAALALANDPDADRLAVAVRTGPGTYRQLSGNEVGFLLGDDALAHTPGGTVATTIVSSRLLSVIAKARGGRYFETLTGFKWIANGALERAPRGETFVFGYEEALGYTMGNLVRDKDGISAVVAIAELAAELAAGGKTLLDRLAELYQRHGLYLAEQRSIATGAGGPAPGERLRRHPPETIAGMAVVSCLDLKTGAWRGPGAAPATAALPSSDVLIYELAGGAQVIVRPSGTEPKVKCYYELRVEVAQGESLVAAEQRGQLALRALIERHQKELAG